MLNDNAAELQTESNFENERSLEIRRAENAGLLLNKKIITQQVLPNPKFVEEFVSYRDVIFDKYRLLNPGPNLDAYIHDADIFESTEKGRDIVIMKVNRPINFRGIKLNANSVFKFDKESFNLISIEPENFPDGILADKLIVRPGILEFNNVSKIYYKIFAEKTYMAALEGTDMSVYAVDDLNTPNKFNIKCTRVVFHELDENNPICIDDTIETAFFIRAFGAGSAISDHPYELGEAAFKEQILFRYVQKADILSQTEKQQINLILLQLGIKLEPNDSRFIKSYESKIEITIKDNLIIEGIKIFPGAVLFIDLNDPEYIEINFPETSEIYVGKIRIHNPSKIHLRHRTNSLRFTYLEGGYIKDKGYKEVKRLYKVYDGYQVITDDGCIYRFSEEYNDIYLVSKFNPELLNIVLQLVGSVDLIHNIVSGDNIHQSLEKLGITTGKSNPYVLYHGEHGEITFTKEMNVHSNLIGLTIPRINDAFVDANGEFLILATDAEQYDIEYGGAYYEGVKGTYINLQTGEVLFRAHRVNLWNGEAFKSSNVNPDTFIGYVNGQIITKGGSGLMKIDIPNNDIQIYKEKLLRQLRIKHIGQFVNSIFEDGLIIHESFESVILFDGAGITGNIYLNCPSSSIAWFTKQLQIDHVEAPEARYRAGQMSVNFDHYLNITGINDVYFSRYSQTFPLIVTSLKGDIKIEIEHKIFRTSEINITENGISFINKSNTIDLLWEDILSRQVALDNFVPEDLLTENNTVNIPTKEELLSFSRKLTLEVLHLETTNDYQNIGFVESPYSFARWSYEEGNKFYGEFTLEEWTNFYSPFFQYKYYSSVDTENRLIWDINLKNNLDAIDHLFLYALYADKLGESNLNIEKNVLDHLNNTSPQLLNIYAAEVLSLLKLFDESNQELIEIVGSKLKVSSSDLEPIPQLGIPVKYSTVKGFKDGNFKIQDGRLNWITKEEKLEIELQRLERVRDLSTTVEMTRNIETIIESGKVNLNILGQVIKIVETLFGFKIEGVDLAKNFIIIGMIMKFASENLQDFKKNPSKQSFDDSLNKLRENINQAKKGALSEDEIRFELKNENILRMLMFMSSGALPKEYVVFTILTLISSGVEISEIKNVFTLDSIIAKEREAEIGIPYQQLRNEILEVKKNGTAEALREIISSSVNKLINYIRKYHKYENYSRDFLVMCRLLNVEGEFATNCLGISLIFQTILDIMLEGICTVSPVSLHHHLNTDIEDWFNNLDFITMAGHGVFLITLPKQEGEETTYLMGDPLGVITRVENAPVERGVFAKSINLIMFKESDQVETESSKRHLIKSKLIQINSDKPVEVVRKDGSHEIINITNNDYYQVYSERNLMLINSALSNFPDLVEYTYQLDPDDVSNILSIILSNNYIGDKRPIFEKYMEVFYKNSGFDYESVNINEIIKMNLRLLQFALSNKYDFDALFLCNVLIVKLSKNSKGNDSYSKDLVSVEAQRQLILNKISELTEEEIRKKVKTKKYLLRQIDIDSIWTNYDCRKLIKEISHDHSHNIGLLTQVFSERILKNIFNDFLYTSPKEMKSFFTSLMRNCLYNEKGVYILILLNKLKETKTFEKDYEYFDTLEYELTHLILKTKTIDEIENEFGYLIDSELMKQIQIANNSKIKEISLNNINKFLSELAFEQRAGDEDTRDESVEKGVIETLATTITRLEIEEGMRKADDPDRIEEITIDVEQSVLKAADKFEVLHQEEPIENLDQNYIPIQVEDSDNAIKLLGGIYGDDILPLLLSSFFHNVGDTVLVNRLEDNLIRNGYQLLDSREAAQTLLERNIPLLSE